MTEHERETYSLELDRLAGIGTDADRPETAMPSCICRPNDPCDYHAATCTTCGPSGCSGHPGTVTPRRRLFS